MKKSIITITLFLLALVASVIWFDFLAGFLSGLYDKEYTTEQAMLHGILSILLYNWSARVVREW